MSPSGITKISVFLLLCISAINGCRFRSTQVATCSQQCDWTDSTLWENCIAGYPGSEDDVTVSSPGNYTIVFSANQDFTLKSLTLGSGDSDELGLFQTVIVKNSNKNFNVGISTLRSCGVLTFDLSGGVATGNTINSVEGSSLNIVSDLTNRIPINSDGRINVRSSEANFGATVFGAGAINIDAASVVQFNGNVSQAAVTSYGRVYGDFKFLSGKFFNMGIIGMESQVNTMSFNQLYLNSSNVYIHIEDVQHYTKVHARSATLAGNLTAYLFRDLRPAEDVNLNIFSSEANYVGMFANTTFIEANDYYNPQSCVPSVEPMTFTQIYIKFKDCVFVVGEDYPDSDFFLGYDKQTMIIVGVATAVGVVIIVVVAVVLRTCRNRTAVKKEQRNFYNLKDEEFYAEDGKDDKEDKKSKK